MQDLKAKILSNERLAKDIYRMVLSCDTSEITAPGQFINIKLPGRYLRRPISICDWQPGQLTIIYKVVGDGTADMSEMKECDRLEVLLPLGNGYDVDAIPEGAYLVGGGVGIPPLYGLAKAIKDKNPKVLLGFNTLEEAFYVNEFHELGIEMDVKIGGFVTEILPEGSYVCACGPMVMLKAVDALAADGQYSFEARMGCGFGACMGCSMKTKEGPKRVCTEGPVFRKEEIVW